MQTGIEPNRVGRIGWLDVARGAALVAMAIYHFAWDLEFFGYAAPGMTAVGGWKLFARCIASTFLFLVGVSLVLAHQNGVRWPGFWKRFAMVAGAAAAISAATYVATPGAFIFFGILHQIALASLLGLLFLRLPALLTLLAAAAVIAAPYYLRSDFFDHAAWWWVGLSLRNPRSNDYVPLFPWFGAVLIGIATAKLATSAGLFQRLSQIMPGRWSRPLAFFGRHSLAFYLVHQPILIAGLWLFAQVFPAEVVPREGQFRASCEASCGQERDQPFCAQYCICMLDALRRDNLLDQLYAAEQKPELQTQLQDAAMLCTFQIDNPEPEQPTP